MEQQLITGEYLAKYDLYLQYMPMPGTVRGSITTVDGEPVALINMDLGDWDKLIAVWHEVLHHLRGDLRADADIRQLEHGK